MKNTYSRESSGIVFTIAREKVKNGWPKYGLFQEIYLNFLEGIKVKTPLQKNIKNFYRPEKKLNILNRGPFKKI